MKEVRLIDIAYIESSQKEKIYPKGTIYFRTSAVDGIVHKLDISDNIAESNIVIIPKEAIPLAYLQYIVQMAVPNFFKRYVQNINIENSILDKMTVKFHKSQEVRELISKTLEYIEYIEKKEERKIELLRRLKMRQLKKMFPRGE